MSIQEHLNKIRNAVYGHEVRESIAKGIETAYNDASEKDNANMEVKIARGNHSNLSQRLLSTDQQLAQTAKKSELEIERQRISNLTANAGNTDGNAELLDIRVGFDGVIYPSAGEATRALSGYMKTENESWVI